VVVPYGEGGRASAAATLVPERSHPDESNADKRAGSYLEPVPMQPAVRSPHAICRWELDAPVPARHLREVAASFCGALLGEVGRAVDELVIRERLAVFALPRIPVTPGGEEAVAVGISVPRRPSGWTGEALRDAIRFICKDGFDVAGRPMRLRPARALGLDVRRWVGPSRLWTSVTPAVFGSSLPPKRPAHRKRFMLDALGEALLGGAGSVQRSATMEGLVEEVAAHEEAWIAGLPRASGFVDGRSGAPTYFRVTFQEPVEGPIVIGRDRLLGMGLLAPL
jgi:CRISPR-associated protein Csb2